MADDVELVQIKKEPEFVVCHNNDDVELALDPFADSDSIPHVKTEYVEPDFEDFDVNEVRIVQFKEEPDRNEIDHDNDFEYNAFDGGNDFQNDFDDYTNCEPVSHTQSKPIVELRENVVANEANDLKTKHPSKSAVKIDSANIVKDIDQITDSKEIKPKMKVAKHTETETKSDAKAGAKKKGRPKSQDEHKCTYCGKCYQYASLLKLHFRTHMINKGHDCPLCGKSFARSDHCKQHLNNVHKGEVVDGVVRKPTFEAKCDICNKVFHHSGNLRKHMVLHSGERPFNCAECGRTFVLAQHLKSHMKLVHSDEKSFQCSICGKLFNHSGNYKKHMKVHSGERSYHCYCGKSFGQSSNYQAHMRVHMNDRPYKCDECDKSFVQAINLTLHKRVHSGEKPFECPTCHRTFRRKSQCASHMKVHNSNKPFKCSQCPRQFTHQTHLRTHEKNHTAIPQYQCPDCEKAFIYNHQLVAHLRSHTGERPFPCEECGARFTSIAQQKRHIKMQHEEHFLSEAKLQCCIECNKIFRDKRLLANHMKIHSGVKPFKCDFCEKCFITHSDCKKHMRIHTGEKPYQCEIENCQKQFTFSNSYRIHMRNHSGEKPFKCQYCGKAFSCSSDRSKHVKSHTNNAIAPIGNLE